MAKVNDTEQPSESKDENTGGTPFGGRTPAANRPLAPPLGMLTPYEIELLRKSKREMDQVVGELLVKERDT